MSTLKEKKELFEKFSLGYDSLAKDSSANQMVRASVHNTGKVKSLKDLFEQIQTNTNITNDKKLPKRSWTHHAKVTPKPAPEKKKNNDYVKSLPTRIKKKENRKTIYGSSLFPQIEKRSISVQMIEEKIEIKEETKEEENEKQQTKRILPITPGRESENKIRGWKTNYRSFRTKSEIKNFYTETRERFPHAERKWKRDQKVFQTKSDIEGFYAYIRYTTEPKAGEIILNENNFLEKLSDAALAYIFQFIPDEDVWNVLSVCKKWLYIGQIAFGLSDEKILGHMYLQKQIPVARALLIDLNSKVEVDFNYALLCAAEFQDWELVRQLLEREVDPTADDNFLIQAAAECGQKDIVLRLLQDKRVDPSANDNYAIQIACEKGHKDIVTALLKDSRVDPSVNHNYCIKVAYTGGFLEVLKEIAKDNRVDLSIVEEIFVKATQIPQTHQKLCQELKSKTKVEGKTPTNSFEEKPKEETKLEITQEAVTIEEKPEEKKDDEKLEEKSIENMKQDQENQSEQEQPKNNRLINQLVEINLPPSTPPTGRRRPIRRRRVVHVDQAEISEQMGSEAQDKWLNYSDIEIKKQLSVGSSGQVFKGIYQGKEVAIKVLETNQSVETFRHEFKILSSVVGSYIVSFFGACVKPQLCLVMEFAEHGSLFDVLQDPKIHIGWKEMLGFAVQMTKGLMALHDHDPQILHRDIKSMNFLVDKEWRVKVCDFGLARFANPAFMSTLLKLRGTMLYCSPETCEGEQYTSKSDIYSLGICFWEIINRVITGKHSTPYAELQVSSGLQVLLQVPKGLRPTIPPNCPPSMKSFLKAVWHNQASERPDAGQLIAFLEECQKNLEEQPQNWLPSQFQK